MIEYPDSVLTLLDEGRISIRGLLLFQFGTGTYGFIKANAPLSYNSVQYNPGGIIKVSDIIEVPGMTAQGFTISLATSDATDLTPQVLQSIEAEDYRDRPVTISDAYFHPDTGELLFVQALVRGYCDTVSHVDNYADGYMINMQCETRSLDYTRTNGRKRTSSDQKLRNATDEWFEYSTMRGREVVLWGQVLGNSSAQQSVITAIRTSGGISGIV